jgi:hypothetical protein
MSIAISTAKKYQNFLVSEKIRYHGGLGLGHIFETPEMDNSGRRSTSALIYVKEHDSFLEFG